MFLAESIDRFLVLGLHRVVDFFDLKLTLLDGNLDLAQLPLVLGDLLADKLEFVCEVSDTLLQLVLGCAGELDILFDLRKLALGLLLPPLVLILSREGLLPLGRQFGDLALHLS